MVREIGRFVAHETAGCAGGGRRSVRAGQQTPLGCLGAVARTRARRLGDTNVSRHHAVIIDTGTSYVITDLHSANDVDVRGQRIRGTATLGHGDIRICDTSSPSRSADRRRRDRRGFASGFAVGTFTRH
jgi:FHA domain